jgi:tRNA pseudouridine55 synthase
MFGLLNINKPIGMTSRDVVARVTKLIRPVKAGHAGTLDPLASGVLIVCVGQATRLVEYVQRMTKRYTATFTLGQESPTGDLEGPITTLDNASVPSRDEILAKAASFVGEIDQIPPAYSAVKVGGRRAYRMARKGQLVALAPRKITIHQLVVIHYDYPALTLNIECGSGTYIRSLGRDLAKSLGAVAVMSELVRTAIGPFRLEEAETLDNLSGGNIEGRLLSATSAVSMLPRITLSANELSEVASGRSIARPESHPGEEVAAVDEFGTLRSILAGADSGQLQPTRNFVL